MDSGLSVTERNGSVRLLFHAGILESVILIRFVSAPLELLPNKALAKLYQLKTYYSHPSPIRLCDSSANTQISGCRITTFDELVQKCLGALYFLQRNDWKVPYCNTIMRPQMGSKLITKNKKPIPQQGNASKTASNAAKWPSYLVCRCIQRVIRPAFINECRWRIVYVTPELPFHSSAVWCI